MCFPKEARLQALAARRALAQASLGDPSTQDTVAALGARPSARLPQGRLLTLLVGCSQYAMLVSRVSQSRGEELYLCSGSSLLSVSILHCTGQSALSVAQLEDAAGTWGSQEGCKPAAAPAASWACEAHSSGSGVHRGTAGRRPQPPPKRHKGCPRYARHHLSLSSLCPVQCHTGVPTC